MWQLSPDYGCTTPQRNVPQTYLTCDSSLVTPFDHIVSCRQPRFAQPIKQRLEQPAREVPALDIRARVRGKFRINGEQVADGCLGFGATAEMTTGRCHHQIGPE